MSGGLLALLDDVAAIAKVAAASLDDVASQTAKTAAAALDDVAAQTAKAGSKAVGVVIDDAAVTPRYVVGFAAARELPIVAKIAWGSLKNKLLYLLPAALALSALAPWAITPLLMAGGLFLCFEGYEKLHRLLGPKDAHGGDAEDGEGALTPQELEDQKVSGAIRTDMILSAEIMAIALAAVTSPSFWMKAVILAAVGLGVTVLVYGAVALIVKADDFGAALARGRSAVGRSIGRALVLGMPVFLKALSITGMLAMLWVGGGILLHGLHEFGVHGPEDFAKAVGAAVGAPFGPMSGVIGWLGAAAVAGLAGAAAGWAAAQGAKTLNRLRSPAAAS